MRPGSSLSSQPLARLITCPRIRESALAVGVLRVAVVGMMLISNEPREAVQSFLSRAQWVAPEGLGWLAQHVPQSTAFCSGVRAVYYASAALAFIGAYTRVALATLLVSAFVLFGFAQLAGAVLHDMHLLWFLGILLTCRAGDAVSLDEWFRTTPRDVLSRRLWGADEG